MIKKSISPHKITAESKYLLTHSNTLKLLDKNDLSKAQKGFEVLNQITSSCELFEISTLNNLSITYLKQQSTTKAAPLLMKSLEKSRLLINQISHIGTLINLTAASSALGIHSDALLYSLKAKQLLITSTDYKLQIISYYNLAVAYLNLHKFNEAEDTLLAAFSLIQTQKLADSPLSNMLMSLKLFLASQKLTDTATEKPKPKQDLPVKRKILTKQSSATDTSVQLSVYNNARINNLSLKPNPKHKSPAIKRNLTSSRKRIDKGSESNTSSAESIKNVSLRQTLARSKSLRKEVASAKNSSHSTPSRQGSAIGAAEKELGNRMQIIGNHLNKIERKLNDFVELCKPLKILAEDPEEQLDSQRIVKCDLRAIVLIQRAARKNFYMKSIAAIKIQRAYRRFRLRKQQKALIKFKDNPLFKQPKQISRQFIKRKSVN